MGRTTIRIPCIENVAIGTGFDCNVWFPFDVCGILSTLPVLFLHIFCFSTIVNDFVYAGDYNGTLGVIEQICFYVLYTPVFIMSLWSHTSFWTMDPGSVPMGAKPYEIARVEHRKHAATAYSKGDEPEPIVKDTVMNFRKRFPTGVRRCNKCKGNFKPPNAHHDSVTGRCVIRLDNFYTWAGNAVGARNHKSFLLIIFYSWLSSVFVGMLTIIGYVRCGGTSYDSSYDDDSANGTLGNENRGGDIYDPLQFSYLDSENDVFVSQTRALSDLYPACEEKESNLYFDGEVVVVIVIICMAFILTSGLMYDQHRILTLEEGVINCKELFGGETENFRLNWLLPTPVDFSGEACAMIFGYDVDEEANKNGEPWRWKLSNNLARSVSLAESRLSAEERYDKRTGGSAYESDNDSLDDFGTGSIDSASGLL